MRAAHFRPGPAHTCGQPASPNPAAGQDVADLSSPDAADVTPRSGASQWENLGFWGTSNGRCRVDYVLYLGMYVLPELHMRVLG